MGREIRRVPPNWEHPRRRCEHSPWAGGCDEAKRNGGMCYHPLYNLAFGPEMDAWYGEWKKWEAGDRGDCDDPEMKFLEWHGGPPDPEYHRPAWDESIATWFQVYETVSEGCPVTPPFATKEELIDYLATHGDFWDQLRGDGPWSRENAERFVEREWAPSMIMEVTDGHSELKMPRDGA